MAERKQGGWRGPEWPIQRHLIPKPQFTGDKLTDLFLAHNRTRTELWDAFDKQAAAIDADQDLSDSGRRKARAALVATFRENDALKRHRASVEKGRERIRELTAELTKPRSYEGETVYDGQSRANREHRAILRYEGLPADQRRAALRAAIEAKDTGFLAPLLHEAGLLTTADAARVQSVILEGADKAKFAELQELAGRLDDSGQPDPQTSAVEVAGFSVSKLLEHMDEYANVNRDAEDVRAQLSEALKVKGAPLVLSDEDAHNPAKYRAARDLAAQHGRVLSISGPDGAEGEGGTMAPSPNGSNGSGGPPEAA